MYILENVPLSAYSTMRLGGVAAYLTEITDRLDVAKAIEWAEERNLPAIMIGGGSNIIWRDEGFPGLVMVNKIMRTETLQADDETLYFTAGGGEIWDSVVQQVTDQGYSGIEFLSAIPGTCGGAPIQNIGAYGHELAESLMTVEAYDRQAKTLVNLRASECDFGYRTSRFKTTDRGRFFITAITLRVTKTAPRRPFYHSLESYLDEHNITDVTPGAIRQAVIAIRAEKLPDPSVVANTGSFFANPVVSEKQFKEIIANHPKLESWPTKCFWELPDGRYKLAAGALLEYLGFKGATDPETGMGTWPNQALVMINQSAQNTAQLLTFKQKIVDTVQQNFGITLEQEPELLP